MKSTLNKIKKDLINASPNAPDYEGFIKIENKYFYIKGWYKSVSSDLDLHFEFINDEWLNKNKFNSKKFTNWINK
jgi:hypothetical protein